MRLLISNDDGIYSPGVKALAEVFAHDPSMEVTVVCPDRERSATGHALTLQEPLRLDAIINYFHPRIQAWACSGTPADSVKLALDAILAEPPHMVLSGINRGSNLGTDVLYSGTVSAAMEGVLEGLPSIAFSLTSFSSMEFESAAQFAYKLVGHLSANPLAEPILLNVNVPAIPRADICGVVMAKLGIRRYKDLFEKRTDPRGKTYYWLSGVEVEEVPHPDSDLQAIRDNYITITPLKYDLTMHDRLADLGQRFQGLELGM
jgi:5'-nucleotidase